MTPFVLDPTIKKPAAGPPPIVTPTPQKLGAPKPAPATSSKVPFILGGLVVAGLLLRKMF